MRVHPLDAVVDRPPNEAAVATSAAWLALMTGLMVGGDIENPASFAVAAVGGAVLVFAGFAAASRCRVLPRFVGGQRVRLAVLALAVGLVLGAANLLANRLIAESDPTIRVLLAERMTTLKPVVGIVAAPIVEEVGVRLFLMSAVAWIVWRVTKRAGLAFALALVGSSLFFAALHLDRPLPADPALANYYRAALLVKYTLAGLPLGWMFWRWGLPYAIVCHIGSVP
jgi:membrane protease YdiL (CAAX protease family)